MNILTSNTLIYLILKRQSEFFRNLETVMAFLKRPGLKTNLPLFELQTFLSVFFKRTDLNVINYEHFSV